MIYKTKSKSDRRLDSCLGPSLTDRLERFVDLIIALVFLAMLAPLFLLVALAIRWEGPGPVFVRQTCLGRRGWFEKFGFRTTVCEPENLTQVWAQRSTVVGEFLQFTRIDRLPQILNVLRGEMSLIDREGASFLE